jgi:hypothetical protein
VGSDQVYLHIRVVLAIVLGLAITKLLNGIALLIESRNRWSLIKEVSAYGGYEEYLIERRYWFFGLIVVITLMDLIDTSLKGAERWASLTRSRRP